MQGIAARVAAGELDPADVDESTVNDSLAALRSLPPTVPREPDLLIRTSGEQRLSNFMLWDAAYSELHFTDTLWPDFCQADLRAACHSFAQRQRRFGGRPGAK
jgi:undecaprenyl diphosphate synthase